MFPALAHTHKQKYFNYLTIKKEDKISKVVHTISGSRIYPVSTRTSIYIIVRVASSWKKMKWVIFQLFRDYITR